ncbi:hypothetical protein JCM8547_000807 [Rhodosporidiobolus lusitaniae]
MPPDPLDPSSFTQRHVLVPSGRTFHFVDQAPADWVGPVEDAPTLLLCHGFPDLWYGWRYQTAALSQRGFRVLCPSQTGYATSSKPDDLEAYTFKSVAYDMNGVLDQCGVKGKVVVFGHDWGGMVAWRFSEYFPERVLAVASVCTPYLPPPPPSSPYVPLETLVRTKLSNFGYQLFFSSPDSGAKIESVMDQWFTGCFSSQAREEKIKSGKVDKGEWVKEGVFERMVEGMKKAKEEGKVKELPTDPEYQYYMQVFRSTGLTHPLNWYRTRALNFRDEQAARLADKGFPPHIPALLLAATGDAALPPAMATNDAVKKAFEKGGNLRVEMVEGADHWLLQDPRFRNKITHRLEEFAREVLDGKWTPVEQGKGNEGAKL